MKIVRIRIGNYRGTVAREIELPERGVTVIAGPNEAGKSSLAEAIDLAFDHLDSSKKKAVRSVKPVHADEGAEVELDVRAGAYEFTLFKRFHRRTETHLAVSKPRRESLTGREAHDRLQQILAESVDLALWRALRIQQGAALDLPSLAGHTSLAAALDRAAGSARIGDTETSLYDAAEAEFLRYFTPTGQDRKALKRADAAAGQAHADASRVQGDLRATEDLVSQSRRNEIDLRSAQTSEIELAQQVVRARTRRDAARVLQREAGELVERARTAAAQAETATSRLAERTKDLERVADLQHQFDKLAAGAEPQTLEAARCREALDASERRVRDLRKALDGAEARARLCQADFEYRRAKLDLDQLRERLARVLLAERDAKQAEIDLAANPVDAALLEKVRGAHLACERARARADAGSATVRVEALADLALRLGDEARPLGAGEHAELPVRAPLELMIGDVARILVRPGSDAAAQEQTVRKAQEAFDAVLGRAQVVSIEAAEERHAQRRESERRRAELAAVRARDLRDLSLADLERKVGNLAARVAEHDATRAQEPPVPETFDAAQTAHEDAARELALAQETHDAASKERTQFERECNAAQQRQGEAAAQMQVLAAQLATEHKRQAEAESQAPRASLDEERAVRVQAARAARTAAEEKSRALELAGPEEAAALHADAEAAAANSRQEVRRLEMDRERIRAQLETLGERGLHEALGVAQTAMARAERVRDSLRRRAAAAKRLFETLRRHRDAARRAYVEPLRLKIEKLGRIVFGDTFAVELDAGLAVVSRSLRGRTVDFESLSAGAREQISLIARVACAMTVAEEDGGVPLILDDALGYTDPARLEGIGAVLALAGRTTQVIVLTCVPERYARIGDKRVLRIEPIDALASADTGPDTP